MSETTSGHDEWRIWVLVSVLFLSYLCVAIPLATVSVFVAVRLGLGSTLAGTAVGVAFLSTILSRGHAGALSDRRGPKFAVNRGLVYYGAGALLSLAAGIFAEMPWTAYAILILGRLLIGLGESLVGVGVIAWGIGIVGPQRAGRVLALIGAAIYGALAIGGPVGLVLFNQTGFAVAMGISAVLPMLGLLATSRMIGTNPHPEAERPSLSSVIRQIWLHGSIVCLQGIGFAAISSFFVLYFLSQGWAYAGFGLTAFGAGFVLVRLLFGHLPDRIGGLPVAGGSLAVEAVGQLVIWASHEPIMALSGAFLTGLGCSMVFPAMGREVVRLVPPHLRATALGGFSAFQDLAYGLTGPIAGVLATRAGYGSVFLLGTAAAVCGFSVVLLLRLKQAIAALS